MSVNQFPVLRAMSAGQAASALARYERHVRRLSATWLDMELYTRVSEEVDEIRHFISAFPDLSIPCSAVLMSHAELIHALWASGQPSAVADSGEVSRRLEEHLYCIDALARLCLRIAGPGAGMDDLTG